MSISLSFDTLEFAAKEILAGRVPGATLDRIANLIWVTTDAPATTSTAAVIIGSMLIEEASDGTAAKAIVQDLAQALLTVFRGSQNEVVTRILRQAEEATLLSLEHGPSELGLLCIDGVTRYATRLATLDAG